jgi:hypothetical protein
VRRIPHMHTLVSLVIIVAAGPSPLPRAIGHSAEQILGSALTPVHAM